MLATYVCLSYWATVWSNKIDPYIANSPSVIHAQQNMTQAFKYMTESICKCLCHLITPICTTIWSGAGQ